MYLWNFNLERNFNFKFRDDKETDRKFSIQKLVSYLIYIYIYIYASNV